MLLDRPPREPRLPDLDRRSGGLKRRDAVGAGSLALLVLASGCASHSSRAPGSGAGPPRALPLVRNGPAPDVRAIHGHWDLAFVRRGRLYRLDARTGGLRELTHSGLVSMPAWSPDGRWIAFIRPAAGFYSEGPLWLVRADGSQLHRVGVLPGPADAFHWSPSSDTLAVLLATPARPSRGVWLVLATGSPRRIAQRLRGVGSFAWSPDGRYLAVEAQPAPGPAGDLRDSVYTVGVAHGNIVRRAVIPPMRRNVSVAIVAGWWHDGRGILYWIDPDGSASIAADGLRLFSLLLGARHARPLAYTLPYQDWVAPSPTREQILLVRGRERPEYFGKTLAVCQLRQALCSPTLYRRGTISVDPAWSADGNKLAFVEARSVDTWGFSRPQTYRSWVRTRRLWVSVPYRSNPSLVREAGHGVYDPTWARDGKHIFYVRDQAVWLVALGGGAPERVANLSPAPRSAQTNLFGQLGYYGHISWRALYALYPGGK